MGRNMKKEGKIIIKLDVDWKNEEQKEIAEKALQNILKAWIVFYTPTDNDKGFEITKGDITKKIL